MGQGNTGVDNVGQGNTGDANKGQVRRDALLHVLLRMPCLWGSHIPLPSGA